MTGIRVLVFSDPNVSSIVEALSPFASVKEVDWQYRHIPDSARYILLKIPYRAIEGIYWILRVAREIHLFQAEPLGVMDDNNDREIHSWSSYSDPLPIEIQLPPFPTSQVPEEVEEAYNVFLGNVSLLASVMLVIGVYVVILNWRSKKTET